MPGIAGGRTRETLGSYRAMPRSLRYIPTECLFLEHGTTFTGYRHPTSLLHRDEPSVLPRPDKVRTRST